MRPSTSHVPRPTADRPRPTAHGPRLTAHGSPPTLLGLLPTAYCLLLLAGCGPRVGATFVVNAEGRDPATLSRTNVEAIGEIMLVRFGRPDAVPRELPEGVGLDPSVLARAAGPMAGDREGRQRGLYHQHCAACHGTAGGGAGALARLLRPYPCDFRLGQFKYTSTRAGGRPARADLDRTIRQGVSATAMPGFERLPRDEINALVDYVVYLSIRGEVERIVAQLVLDEGEYVPLDDYLVDDEAIGPVARQWNEAESLVVGAEDALAAAPPVDTPERLAASIRRGQEFYASNGSQCAQCHGPEGRGDGEERELYDAANKPKRGVSDQQTRRLAERFALPLQRLRARNFHEGVFHGGSRPIDLYWRIHVGIKGTPMPASGPDASTSGALTPGEIWDVVHYILSLSDN
ncbi:MAG: c-type cytochrome [Pirellulales bacterium]|nr:c-type cytochrome [Pirellulales bacterium]